MLFAKSYGFHKQKDESYCTIIHADTAGTKTSLAYVYWRETGDLSVWKGIVQDALVMNLDDMACSGCVDDFIISSTIGRNKKLINGDVLSTLINASSEFAENMKKYGVNLHLAGGETADVGDIVRTIDVGFTAFARLKRSDVIKIDIKEGDYIVGFPPTARQVMKQNTTAVWAVMALLLQGTMYFLKYINLNIRKLLIQPLRSHWCMQEASW